MEASPFHHNHNHNHRPFLFDQCLSFTNTAASDISDQFHQPHDQVIPNGYIEVSAHYGNHLQSSDSSMSIMVPDHKLEMKTTNSSFNSAQSNGTAKKTSRRWRNPNKSNDNREKKKKMGVSKEEGQIGYIHVRARRGEATDSHSLAERVRREKISEKMKALQAIVPGCDKITGKALMLEEVINYVQSLQNEIQILSSKLAYVDLMLYDSGEDFDTLMFKPDHQNMATYQQQLLLLQEDQMPCMISQNNEEILWDLRAQRQEDDDLFSIISNINSIY